MFLLVISFMIVVFSAPIKSLLNRLRMWFYFDPEVKEAVRIKLYHLITLGCTLHEFSVHA